ncbi:MAG: YdcF family protein [Acidimicrobiia bacterium]|nr:YdcF family protein [Acidimicrobiia bacterium]
MFFGLRWVIRIALGLLTVLVLYIGITFAQVWWAARQNDTSPASAIVVMGAAQWNGLPSPVLKDRLDHAAELYQKGVAPVVIVAGGKQAGDKVTQGLVSFEYLRSKGIPEGAIKIEVDGTDSYEELSSTAFIMRKAGLPDDVVIVTDPYHSFRAAGIADEVGLTAHVSPTKGRSTFSDYVRETGAVAIGRIIDYRRLAAWR